jgi:hypothetical protein
MIYLDKLYKARVSELWRELEELDYFVSKCIEGDYYKNLLGYIRTSLIVIEFIKSKPKSEKEIFLENLKNTLYYCREKENWLMEKDYLARIDFFKKEFIDE